MKRERERDVHKLIKSEGGRYVSSGTCVLSG